jgi:hypothetical protein
MPSIGILEKTDTVLWYSSQDIVRYMTLLKYAISFAQNVRDGRLEEVGHTPFQGVDRLEKHFLFVKTQVLEGKKSIVLNFCFDFSESELKSKSWAKHIVKIFVEMFLDRVKVRGNFVEKVHGKQVEFATICDDIFNQTMVGSNLILDDDLLLDPPQAKNKTIVLKFSAIAIQGIPIAAKFYENMAKHFKMTISKSDDTRAVLENLILAQLSTLLFQSLEKGTACNHLIIKFTDFSSFIERNLTINFLPILQGEAAIPGPDDYSLITICEGDPELAFLFQRSVSPLVSETGLLKEKFNGNVARYKSLTDLLGQFPRTLKIDG